jgi:hypothetical protein
VCGRCLVLLAGVPSFDGSGWHLSVVGADELLADSGVADCLT